MWPYAGSKLHLAHLYPKPRFPKIIVSFAGTAGYSLAHFDRDVLLIERNDVVCKIWWWLQQCSQGDILGLPKMKFGERVDQYNFDCEEARWLMGFIITTATTAPRKQATTALETRPNRINFNLRRIAGNLHKIKHWRIMNGDYADATNEEATWFIDPPYQVRKMDYGAPELDYRSLAKWCREREGQVIACDSMEADWLPFKKIQRKGGKLGRKPTTEAIWSNLPTDYDIEQLNIFNPSKE